MIASPKTAQFSLPVFPLEEGDAVIADCHGVTREGSYKGLDSHGWMRVETQAGVLAYRPEEVARC